MNSRSTLQLIQWDKWVILSHWSFVVFVLHSTSPHIFVVCRRRYIYLVCVMCVYYISGRFVMKENLHFVCFACLLWVRQCVLLLCQSVCVCFVCFWVNKLPPDVAVPGIYNIIISTFFLFLSIPIQLISFIRCIRKSGIKHKHIRNLQIYRATMICTPMRNEIIPVHFDNDENKKVLVRDCSSWSKDFEVLSID